MVQLDFLIQAEQTLQEQSDPGGHSGSRKRPGDPDSEDTEDSEVAKRNKVASNDFQVSHFTHLICKMYIKTKKLT